MNMITLSCILKVLKHSSRVGRSTFREGPALNERQDLGDVIQVQSFDRRERKKDCDNEEKFSRVEK